MKNDLLISAEKILDCLNDGVYVCDRNRRIVYLSKSAERITGWRSKDGKDSHKYLKVYTIPKPQ
jgi:PAS domain-containing protein